MLNLDRVVLFDHYHEDDASVKEVVYQNHRYLHVNKCVQIDNHYLSSDRQEQLNHLVLEVDVNRYYIQPFVCHQYINEVTEIGRRIV